MEPTRSSHPSTAFVLAGGGSLGAVQVGMLQVLIEAGISPDLVVGARPDAAWSDLSTYLSFRAPGHRMSGENSWEASTEPRWELSGPIFTRRGFEATLAQ